MGMSMRKAGNSPFYQYFPLLLWESWKTRREERRIIVAITQGLYTS